MKRSILILTLLGVAWGAYGQSNIFFTNPEAEAVVFGLFDPADYAPSVVIDDPVVIANALIDDLSPDSLHAYLVQMSAFGNRNTGSDTTSTTFGMGAARRWAYDKFESFSMQNEGRLLPGYLQFDQVICGMGQHRNVVAILPGQGPQYDEFVLVEAHLDSRCEDGCDGDCMAHGMEDNGSGSALVLELARVMSQFSFNRSIVFMLTTGEEQGLRGANALADYCLANDLQLKAVLNNDIVGGIICGQTASPPGCPGLNDIDSINVRIYSDGITSKHKQLARYVKLEYQENIFPNIAVQTVINIMTPEDRTGRGGDHIPFRENGYPAIRFTSANEHGDGNPSQPGYEDRQHSMEDVLGVDTDNDGLLDSFFVDFHYLARNAVINGNALAMAALGPEPPASLTVEQLGNALVVHIDDPNDLGLYRVAIRELLTNDWDTVFTTNQQVDTLLVDLVPGDTYKVSAATVDADGVESLFSNEESVFFLPTGVKELPWMEKGYTLLQNHPNPFDEATVFAVRVERPISHREAFIVVLDLQGKELARLPITLNQGINEVVYDYQHHRYVPGTYAYSLVVDGQVLETKQMVYAY
ncbi:MAG: M28 family metallopeptidase [Saprospiraceae bacterium]|nr:M28 family metallopeptidase [Saprospiraceae bacterium]